MNKKRNQQEYDIAELLTAVFDATCSFCDTSEKIEALEDSEAACGFYESGWRAKHGELLCRKCLKRK